MKHNLTLTDLIINRDEGPYADRASIEIVATINGNMIRHISRPFVPYMNEDVEIEFKDALGGICLQAVCYLQNRNIEVFYPAGMTLHEKLSTFNLKQTTLFSKAMHDELLWTHVITEAIW